MAGACLALGCAHGATPLGDEWTEARSKHFVLKSDLEDRRVPRALIAF